MFEFFLSVALFIASGVIAYNLAYECHDEPGRNLLIVVIAVVMAAFTGVARMSADSMPAAIFVLAIIAGLAGKYRARAKAFTKYREQDAKDAAHYNVKEM